MKNLIFTILFLISPISEMSGQSFSAMSFNIRYDNPNDGENRWEERKIDLAELIKRYNPAFLGIQEGLVNQVKFIDSVLTNHIMTGVGREDGASKGEFSAIYFDSSKFELIGGKTFWLSDKSDTVSIGWDAALERICTYGIFKMKADGKKIYVFNTHFDHIGVKARRNSAKLILKKIDEIVPHNQPILLMGDFNSTSEDEAIKIIQSYLDDGVLVSKKKSLQPAGTFNGFDKDRELNERIDFIFIKNLNVFSYQHINDKRKDSGFISDHIPVFIEAGFTQ